MLMSGKHHWMEWSWLSKEEQERLLLRTARRLNHWRKKQVRRITKKILNASKEKGHNAGKQ